MAWKGISQHNARKSRLSGSLNTQHWRFLQSGLDDFRYGFPPLCGNANIQPMKQPAPVVLPGISEGTGRTQHKVTRTRRRKPVCSVSKQSPMMAARRDCIAETEYYLIQHSLALYPHLEESVPPKLFKEVVGILDPDMLPIGDDSDTETELEECILPTVHSQLEKRRSRQAKPKMTNWKDLRGKDPYTWFSKKEVMARERKAKLNYVPPLPENVKQATKELCSWLDSLGGEKYDIDEDTITSLFDINYKTKPPPSLPINVVELIDLPIELQKYAGISPPDVTIKCAAQQDRYPKESCHTKWEKIRYGAWYLEPKSWKKLKVDEPLEDPNSKATSIKMSKGELDEKDAEILQLHGTHAFKEFLERKYYQIPKFLSRMLAVQDQKSDFRRAL